MNQCKEDKVKYKKEKTQRGDYFEVFPSSMYQTACARPPQYKPADIPYCSNEKLFNSTSWFFYLCRPVTFWHSVKVTGQSTKVLALK